MSHLSPQIGKSIASITGNLIPAEAEGQGERQRKKRKLVHYEGDDEQAATRGGKEEEEKEVEEDDIEFLRTISDVTPSEGDWTYLCGNGICLPSLGVPISPPLRPKERIVRSVKGEQPKKEEKEDILTEYIPRIELLEGSGSIDGGKGIEGALHPSEILDPIDEPDPSVALFRYLSSLEKYSRPIPDVKTQNSPSKDQPRILLRRFKELFYENLGPKGHHYVIHQHDHPQAGLHYDLRLQFSETSTVSWAVPKGLPCNLKSRQRRRLAVETRVHPYWYSVVEGGSMWSGTTVVWDCGTYEVLPNSRETRKAREETPERDGEEGSTDEEAERGGSEGGDGIQPEDKGENHKLIEAFRRGSINLHLQGTRIKSSIFSLRIATDNLGHRISIPTLSPSTPPPNTRYSKGRYNVAPPGSPTSVSAPAPLSPSKEPKAFQPQPSYKLPLSKHLPALVPALENTTNHIINQASRSPPPSHTQSFKQTNAYPHSQNTIGSLPQRTWLLTRSSVISLPNSTIKVRKKNVLRQEVNRDSFIVYGKPYERSVVTGRTAWEVQCDLEEFEGVKGMRGFIGRGGKEESTTSGWKGIFE